MNINPTILLDIDGIISLLSQFYSNKKTWHPSYDCYRFDEKCVKVLNSILDNLNNPIIIISSDWKNQYTIKELNEIFKWNGVNGIVSDITPDLWGSLYNSLLQLEECRAAEILYYVQEFKPINWVAVDDLNLTPWIPNNFVWCTRVSEGIKQSGIKDKILNILQ